MKRVSYLLAALAALFSMFHVSYGQDHSGTEAEIDKSGHPPKIQHAEPLYVDLIRDLGARKGEAEWNMGFGMTDRHDYTHYQMMVEYEFAPIHRLGFEIEVPISLYASFQHDSELSLPPNRINGLKTAVQYTFLVSETHSTSMALGYMHEFEFNPFQQMKNKVVQGDLHSPFFVAAKRWGNHFHTLIYSGPVVENVESHAHTHWQHHTSIHYMIAGTRNYVGVEFNEEMDAHHHSLTLRPQMRVALQEQLVMGLAAGIPMNSHDEGLGFFVRVIYEPPHQKH